MVGVCVKTCDGDSQFIQVRQRTLVEFPEGHIIYKEGETQAVSPMSFWKVKSEVSYEGKVIETTTAGGLLGELSAD
jgi:hypothetical protein